METEDLLIKMKELDTSSLLHELRESRRRAIDFMDAQQGILLELKSRPPEIVEKIVIQEVPQAKNSEKVESPTVEPEKEDALDSDQFFISEDDLASVIEESKSIEPETVQKVDISTEYKKDFEFSEDLAVSTEDADELLVTSHIGKVSSSEEEADTLDPSEIDSLLDGGEEAEAGALDPDVVGSLPTSTDEPEPEVESGELDQGEIDSLLDGGGDEVESGVLDQGEIDSLLDGGEEVETAALGPEVVDSLATSTDEAESGELDQGEIDSLLDGGESESGVLDQDEIDSLLDGGGGDAEGSDLDSGEIETSLDGGGGDGEASELDQGEIDSLLRGEAGGDTNALDVGDIGSLLGGETEEDALDSGEIDSLLSDSENSIDEGEDIEVAENDDFTMLDQSAIDELLEGIEPEQAVGEIDLEELAELTDKQESLSDEDVSSLMEKAKVLEEHEEKSVEKPTVKAEYEKVDQEEVGALEVELNRAREEKREEDLKEVERIKALGRAETNENKQKPTAEEIEERLIDADEATELDEELSNLKKLDS